MIFNSFEYLVFLPLVLVLYWVLKKDLKKQNVLLLISSYVFYGFWDWRFLGLIVYSSIVDYIVGIRMDKSDNPSHRKNWLLFSLFSNLGLLAVFKYFNFFADSFADMMNIFGWQVDNLTLNIILPVGISFYTFQTLSYTIDIYRKQLKPTKNIVSFFTYVSFFPQLVAGPIERASNLLPQIENKRTFSDKKFSEGIFQILIGLFRKIVIADNLGIYVDTIYGNPGVYNSSTLLLATVFYAFQIYYDFAGYSDIAIGSAKLFGFKFQKNFNFPYFSKSITEFWRRWHMSLSFWLRDYLYISLGGNRKGIKITYRNLLITMLLGGLWHGSSWNFVIWGGIHGVILSLEKYIFSITKRSSFGILGYPFTFLVVLIAWVFFRSPDFNTASIIIHKLVYFEFGSLMPMITDSNIMATEICMLVIGIFIDFYLYSRKQAIETFGGILSPIKLAIIASLLILFMCLFYSTSDNFIYFQF